MASFSEQFKKARSSHISWNGEELYGLYERAATPSLMRIHFISFVDAPIQGIRLKIRGGTMSVGDVTSDEILLWTDTAPSYVEVKVNASENSTLKIWNVWRTNAGVEHSWMNNAAIQIERTSADGVLLRCSDGVGEPDFKDLVFAMDVSS